MNAGFRTSNSSGWATVVGASALLLHACGPSHADVDRAIDRGAPLVKAILAYEADVGHPPPSLSVLIPKYIKEVPTTGLDGFPDFRYTVHQPPRARWHLSVRLENIGFKHMRYDPTKQYEIPVTELRDGWVVVAP